MHTDASETAIDLDSPEKMLREELKEVKIRERRLQNDYSELKEQNIVLQKQVILDCVYLLLTHHFL